MDRGDRDVDYELDEVTAEPPRIRCPRCEWTPKPTSRWYCLCSHGWNSFDTGGRCPACGEQWEDTQCLSCGKWSKHLDWYTEDE